VTVERTLSRGALGKITEHNMSRPRRGRKAWQLFRKYRVSIVLLLLPPPPLQPRVGSGLLH
jgi:hypothetical protein